MYPSHTGAGRRRARLALVATVAAVLLSVSPATAAPVGSTAPPLPPAPLRSSLEESWLGGLEVSPHIVNVGQTVSMTIGDPPLWTKSCLGMSPQHPKCIESIGWTVPPFTKKVGGCGIHDATCDWPPP